MVRVVVLALAAGCSFQPGVLQRDAGAGSDGVADDDGGSHGSDAASDGMPADADVSGLCGGKIWFADFSTDPTAYDNNGDGVNDFKARTGTFNTQQLVNGEWQVPGTMFPPLDMQPSQTFLTRILVRTRMRGTATAGAHGAVFYINVAQDADSFASLFADAHLTGANQQEVNFVNPLSPDVELLSVPGFTGEAIEIELDIDPSTLSFTYAINGVAGASTLTFQERSGTTTAGFGTLTAYSTAAAFDELYVEVCP